ncbi:Nup133 N terminal like-domain-containing protein [Dipodascopsis tothii]|uniref:Nup133 N terminal like-domain-containing protein n=1 Tax=Dipodascopsis tothii TaxID=44089 RepID=UPI0034CD639A
MHSTRQMSARRSARLQARHKAAGRPDDSDAGSQALALTAERRPRDSAVEWTRNAKYSVLKLPALPNVLRAAPDAVFNGHLDASTDSALILSPTAAYVWPYTSPDHLPTTLSFPVASPSAALPLGIVVSPSAGSSEPGLVLVHPHSGSIIYWEAVGGAIAEGLLHRKKGVEAQIKLFAGETLAHAVNIEPAGVVAATSTGRFILVSLRDTVGRPAISYVVMRGSGAGLWSNLKGVLNLGGTRRDLVGLKPGRVLGRGERGVVTVNVRGAVTLWHCARSGDYSLAFEMDLGEMLTQSLSEVYPTAERTFEVHDIELLPGADARCLLLASFVYDEGVAESAALTRTQTYYVLFTVELDPVDPRVVSTHRVTCYGAPSARRPRLYLPQPAQTAFIVLSGAVLMVDTHADPVQHFKWEDYVEFRPGADVLLAGAEDQLYADGQVTRHAGVVLVVRNAGVIRVERFEDAPDAVASADAVIKSRIEQAVFFGHVAETALAFGQRPEHRYDVHVVERVVGEICAEILNAKSPFLPAADTLGSLELRCDKLRTLVLYLQDVLASLSVECRVKTLYMLEKAEAGRRVLAAAADAADGSVLAAAVAALGGSSVDSWFRGSLDRMGDLLCRLARVCLERAAADAAARGVAPHVRDADELVAGTLLGAVYPLREQYMAPILGLATLSPSAVAEYSGAAAIPWTCSLDMLSTLHKLFETTRALATDSDESGLADHLVALADLLCRAYAERVAYCCDNRGLKTEGETVRARYLAERGSWLKPLAAVGRRHDAYRLAEAYGDFLTLAELARADRAAFDAALATATGAGDADAAADAEHALALLDERMRHYFDTYGYDFAAVLYGYYVDTGLVEALLVEFQEYAPLLERFFAAGKHDHISWLHDVRAGRLAAAGAKLSKTVDVGHGSDATKRLQLGLGKLCVVAAAPDAADDLAYFDDRLAALARPRVH